MSDIIKCVICGSDRKVDDNLIIEKCTACGDEEYDSDDYNDDFETEAFDEGFVDIWS